MTSEIRDSKKRWAVLYMAVRRDGGFTVMPEQTEYYWTRWGARRRVRLFSTGPVYNGRPLWVSKVVRNE